jgi:hypothetical protein
MTLTVKLPADLERDLTLHCETEGLTKSEVVTRLVQQYLDLQRPTKTAHELAVRHGLIGCFQSGQTNLARRHSQAVKERMRAKRAR